MGDHPHENAIDILQEASADYPVALLLLDEEGPRLNISTGIRANRSRHN